MFRGTDELEANTVAGSELDPYEQAMIEAELEKFEIARARATCIPDEVRDDE